MNTCKFCKNKIADKKNTHYLTDAIIRTCLNKDGSNQRGKGLYYSINNKVPFVSPHFQQLDEDTIVNNLLGRKPTDEEIEKAKEVPYSADNIFCSDCEKKFTEIETKFIKDILPKFRNTDLSGKESIEIEDNILCRNFFYLQIFRSAICDREAKFPSEFIENLRVILYEKREDTSIPLSITYLQTLGGQEYYTENMVGFTNDSNPFAILMNDFFIQFYDDERNVKFIEFYGLNREEDYQNFIHVDEEEGFVFKILNDKERKIINTGFQKEKVKSEIKFYKDLFVFLCEKVGMVSTEYEKYRFSQELNKYLSSDGVNKLSEENMMGFLQSYFNTVLSRQRVGVKFFMNFC